MVNNSFIHPSAVIGSDTIIENNVYINKNVKIGKNCRIQNGAYIGYNISTKENQTILGNNCLIANNSTIYAGVVLNDNVKVRHNSIIRENVEVGESSNIGSLNTIEFDTKIGKFCSFHSRVHITDLSRIGDYVFIGPNFTSMSDSNLDYRRPQISKKYTGITISNAARIGGDVTVLPGIKIGFETMIGAGSFVKNNLPDWSLCLGDPARPVKKIVKEDGVSKLD